MHDLDDRILKAEQRLIAREKALGEHVNELARRVRRAWQPQRVMGPVLGTAFVLLGIGWLTGRAGRGVAARRSGAPRAPGESRWMRMIALVWPMLPQSWRDRAGPAASAAVTLGVPLVLERQTRPPPRTMDAVDLTRYAGTWFEIARLPAPFEGACRGQPTATYTLRQEGGDTVIEVLNRCQGARDRMREARGEARVVRGSGGARLQVNLAPAWLRWLPGAWADYWILHLDPGYTVALVGSPNRNYLWVLARQPRVSAEQLQQLVALGGEQGFPVEKLKIVQPD